MAVCMRGPDEWKEPSLTDISDSRSAESQSVVSGESVKLRESRSLEGTRGWPRPPLPPLTLLEEFAGGSSCCSLFRDWLPALPLALLLPPKFTRGWSSGDTPTIGPLEAKAAGMTARLLGGALCSENGK